MLRLREIMTTELMTVSPQTTVREAMELLGLHHVSGAPVLSGERLVGVVTGTDLMTFAASLSGVPTEREANDAWDESAEASSRAEIDSENEPSGVFFSDLWDDAGVEATGRMANTSSPEWNVLEEHDVSEVMTATPLTTLGPDASVESAARLMHERGIHRVFVTDGETLLGVVSALDVAEAAAGGRLTRHTYVFNSKR